MLAVLEYTDYNPCRGIRPFPLPKKGGSWYVTKLYLMVKL